MLTRPLVSKPFWSAPYMCVHLSTKMISSKCWIGRIAIKWWPVSNWGHFWGQSMSPSLSSSLSFIYFTWVYNTVILKKRKNCFFISSSTICLAYRSLCFPAFYSLSPVYEIQARNSRTDFEYSKRWIVVIYLFYLFIISLSLTHPLRSLALPPVGFRPRVWKTMDWIMCYCLH